MRAPLVVHGCKHPAPLPLSLPVSTQGRRLLFRLRSRTPCVCQQNFWGIPKTEGPRGSEEPSHRPARSPFATDSEATAGLRKRAESAALVATASLVCHFSVAVAAASALPTASQLMESSQDMYMMEGETLFNPKRYSGIWYEIASEKKGFAGEGQQDCHCTQGLYSFNFSTAALSVDTFCVHGSPQGKLSGIRGAVKCVDADMLAQQETALEREEMIQEKCFLSFPSIPFVPPQPYDVIATDYTSFALVQGSKDRSFIQVYSREPNPPPNFYEDKMDTLKSLGWDISQIKPTPQDCMEDAMEVMMEEMMTSDEKEAMLTNTVAATNKRGSGKGVGNAAKIIMEKGAAVDFQVVNPFKSVVDYLGLFGGDE